MLHGGFPPKSVIGLAWWYCTALCLNSPDGIAEMKHLAITSAGLFSLSVGKIRKISYPLPPLAEQHRIVAKVSELMELCDKLEASLAAGDESRRRLVEALLAEALAPDEECCFGRQDELAA